MKALIANFYSIFIVLVLALLSGCVSLEPVPDQTQFYILTGSSDQTELEDALNCKGLNVAIARVGLPGYLDTQKIVTRTTDSQLRISEYNRWAEPLGETVAQTLADNLETLLALEAVTTFPWTSPQPRALEIFLDVRKFEMQSDGRVELDAVWIISSPLSKSIYVAGRGAYTESTNREYFSIVEAMSRALERLSRAIAEDIAGQVKKLLHLQKQGSCDVKTKNEESACVVAKCAYPKTDLNKYSRAAPKGDSQDTSTDNLPKSPFTIQVDPLTIQQKDIDFGLEDERPLRALSPAAEKAANRLK